MAEQRRPLIDGLKTPGPPVNPALEKAFVFAGKTAAAPEPDPSPSPSVQSVAVPPRVPISTRMRSDYATALKRASLERQLSGIEPNALQDILEQAIEPWLRSNGYLK
jgi:hypothetical protein